MNDKLSVREDVPVEQTWRLEDIYPDERLWEEELQQAKDLAAKVKEYEGKLSESAQKLYEALKLYDDCSLKLDRVGQDQRGAVFYGTRNTGNSGRRDRALL